MVAPAFNMTIVLHKPIRIRFFGSYHKERVARIAVLLDGLRGLRCQCDEMNARLPLNHTQRIGMLKSPWRACLLPLALAHAWVRLIARRLTAPTVDLIVVPYMGHFDILFARLLYPRTLIALDHLVSAADTANDRHARPWLQRVLTLLDYVAVATADIALVDTEEHRTLVPPRFQEKTIVIPIGAPRAWYGEQVQSSIKPLLSIVFFGLFTPLQGTLVIAKALNLLQTRGISFKATLIGRGQDYQAVREQLHRNPHVRWIEWLDENELIKEVSSHDVCLGTFGTSAKAARVVPQKIFLGAAAGCALVTANTAPQVRAFGADAVYVASGNANDLAAKLITLAARPDMLMDFRQRARTRALEDYQPEKIASVLIREIDRRGTN